MFDYQVRLVKLYLNDNALTTLPAHVFEPLDRLWWLHLEDNPGAPFAPEAVALPDDGTVPVTGGTVTLDGIAAAAGRGAQM